VFMARGFEVFVVSVQFVLGLEETETGIVGLFHLQHNLGLGARRANEVRRLFDDVVLRERGGLSKERGGKREKGRESVLCVKSA